MAPGKKPKTAGKRKLPTAKSSEKTRTPKASKSKKAPRENPVPKRSIPAAVLREAEKRKFNIVDLDSSDDGTNKPSKKRRQTASQGLWAHDAFAKRELPAPRDYGASFAKKSTAHYTWGAPLPPRPTPAPKEHTRRDSVLERAVSRRNKKSSSAAAGGCRSAQTRVAGDSDDIYSRTASPDPRNTGKTNKSTAVCKNAEDKDIEHFPLLKLPLEIRQNVYRNILLADEPIRVRQGWSLVYSRDRPCLETSILRACRQVRNEAVNVLYGENTFSYILREAASVPTVDATSENEIVVRHPSMIDDPLSEYECNSEDDYSDDGRIPVARLVHNSEVEIDIRRFGHKFRRIKIVAEPNRYERGYMLSMANAIAVFRNLRPIRARIHTIAFDISPTRDLETGEISFLNFFDKKSEVVRALRGLPCQFIEIFVKSANGKQKRIKLNMKYAANIRRALRGEEDAWKHDPAMLMYRSVRAGEFQDKLDRLPAIIQENWEEPTERSFADWDSDEDQDDYLWGQDYY